MTKYNQETESKMQLHYGNLNEKDRRHYAAAEVIKLGYGGLKYISKLFQLSPQVIRRGIKELNDPSLMEKVPEGKIRQKGGGRKKKKKVILK